MQEEQFSIWEKMRKAKNNNNKKMYTDGDSNFPFSIL